jgi:hypothetical protein
VGDFAPDEREVLGFAHEASRPVEGLERRHRGVTAVFGDQLPERRLRNRPFDVDAQLDFRQSREPCEPIRQPSGKAARFTTVAKQESIVFMRLTNAWRLLLI